jgi:uncharacterized protein with GYD domain
MIFITLAKFKTKPSKESVARADKQFEEAAKMGVRAIGTYWTLGRYDAVRIVEAPDEKTAMKAALALSDIVSTETLVAMKREDAVKLLG